MQGVKVVGILAALLAFAVALLLASECPEPNRVTCRSPCIRGGLYEDNTWCTMATENLCCEYNYEWYECDYMTDDDDKEPDPRCHPRLQWEPKGILAGPRPRPCHTCEKVPGEPDVVRRCEPKATTEETECIS
ncbi:MAG: hypothetical protein PVTTEEND_000023 [Candidatus Fervidibacter sp.]|jgi:hypothetical protein